MRICNIFVKSPGIILMKRTEHLQYNWKSGFRSFTPEEIFSTTSNHFENCWHCPENSGVGIFRKIEIRSGFDIWITDCMFSKNTRMSCCESPEVLIFGFFLSGCYQTPLESRKSEFLFSGEQQYMVSVYEPLGIGRVKTGIPLRQISIIIKPEILFPYFEYDMSLLPAGLHKSCSNRSNTLFHHANFITSAMRRAILQILNCPFQGMPRKLFMESRALELIAYQLEQIAEQKSSSTADVININPTDLKQTELARNLLVSSLEHPPSLSELVKAAGMSHPKLNRCFRQMYDMTVFQYLRNERLHQAGNLLERQKLTVTETAFAVGYDSVSHFSHAYKKHFGNSPGNYHRVVLQN